MSSLGWTCALKAGLAALLLAAYPLSLTYASQPPPVEASCDQVCGQLVGSNIRMGTGTEPAPQRVAGAGNAWNTQDDQWCAAHGYPTGAVEAAPISNGRPANNVAAIPSPFAPNTTTACNVPTFANESCADVNAKDFRCLYHNSQLEQHCMAYEATDDAQWLDYLVLALDLTATATCTNACFGVGFTLGTAEAVCKGAALTAAASELASVIVQGKSAVSDTISTMGALGGGTAAILGSANDLTSLATDATGDVVTDAAKQAGNSVFKDTGACISSMVFAVMAGVRVYDLAQQGASRTAACHKINALYSTAAPVGAAAAGGPQSPAQYLFGQSGAQGAAQSVPGVTSSVPAPPAPAPQHNTQSALSCVGEGGSACSGAYSNFAISTAATDSGLLLSSGMAKVVAPLAAELDHSGLQASLASGAGAGAILSSLLQNQQNPSPDFQAGLIRLAQQSQDHATEIAGIRGVSSGYTVAHSAASATALVLAASGPAPEGPTVADLSAGSRALAGGVFMKPSTTDIWHAGSPDNIFQIISAKTAQVSGRVLGEGGEADTPALLKPKALSAKKSPVDAPYWHAE